MIYITLFFISIILILIACIICGIFYINKNNKIKQTPQQEQTYEEKQEIKAQERIQKESLHFQQELERLKGIKQDTVEIQQYVKEKKITYETKLDKLPTETEHYKVEANKSGFLYVISNKKSFYFDNIFKIGMTRRNDVQKRIKELNGPSVPFPFHVVCTIFSDDVVALETSLHRELTNYRLNKENRYKKEFFKLEKSILIETIKKYDIMVQFNFEE